MKKWLTLKETIFVTSMLFGLFFGAGNLIFPIYMGSLAGENVWPAIFGFIITGVTLPLLAVAALGKSRSNGLFDLGLKVSKPYSLFFTCLLYLSIGPFFAIPRCATTSFTVGIAPIFNDSKLSLFIFSALFFIGAAYFSLKSDKILTYVGKFLNPLFLLVLAILLIKAFINPMSDYQSIEAIAGYDTRPFFNGFYEGYNTLDALAGLAFGIVVVMVLRKLNLKDGDAVAANTIVSGITSCILMGIIYIALALLGASSREVIGQCSNGGEILSKMSIFYFGKYGSILLASIVTLACLKTAVGLITSCSQTFSDLFPNKLSQKQWAIIFLIVSFLISNFGLNSIIKYSLPALMFLYPLAIVLIALALLSNLFHKTPVVYKATMYATLPFATLELLRNMPFENDFFVLIRDISNMLPLGTLGLEWLLPSIIAFVISYLYAKSKA